MRTILIVITLIVACGVGLGFYRGWIGLSSGNDSSQPSITLSVDKDSIEADKDKAVDAVRSQDADDAAAPATEGSQD